MLDASSWLYWSGLLLPVPIAIAGRAKILGKTGLKMYFYTLVLFCMLEGANSLLSLFAYNLVYERPFGFFSYAAYDGLMVLVIHNALKTFYPDYLDDIGYYIPALAFVGFIAAIATEYLGNRFGIFLYEATCFNPYIFDSVSLLPVINVTMILPCIFYFIARFRHRLA